MIVLVHAKKETTQLRTEAHWKSLKCVFLFGFGSHHFYRVVFNVRVLYTLWWVHIFHNRVNQSKAQRISVCIVVYDIICLVKLNTKPTSCPESTSSMGDKAFDEENPNFRRTHVINAQYVVVLCLKIASAYTIQLHFYSPNYIE